MKQNLSKKVADIIRERILNFSLGPGSRLSDKQIAQEMEISRTPVREALNRLTAEGIVKALPNRGFIVKKFELKEIEDIYILRERLETLAVELTILNLTPARQKELEELLTKAESDCNKEDLFGFNTSDESFHDMIALYSENQALGEVLKNLRGKIRVIRRYDHLQPGRLEEAHESHTDILSSITQRDVKGAKEKMSAHIMVSMKTILKFISENRQLYLGLLDGPKLHVKNR
nr:GntR family transcriptional regulator [uncultured Desulfobacter sp.]